MEDLEKTLLDEDRRWCVYIHTNKISNKAYIGITSRNPIARWGNNGENYLNKRNREEYTHPVFAYALLKYPDWNNDWEHMVFADQLTFDEAKHWEMILIALYKTNCCRYNNPSYGYNMTDGGDGGWGHTVSKEGIEKMRVAAKKRYQNPELREKISRSQKLRYENPNAIRSMLGKTHSDETKQKN